MDEEAYLAQGEGAGLSRFLAVAVLLALALMAAWLILGCAAPFPQSATRVAELEQVVSNIVVRADFDLTKPAGEPAGTATPAGTDGDTVGGLAGLIALGVAGYAMALKLKKQIKALDAKYGDKIDKALGTDAKEEGAGGDEVDFSKLSFCWGGVNGANAKRVPGAVIADLKLSGGGMSYRWVSGGCEALGAGGGGDFGKTLACLFADGKGGKFDYISTSRTTRGFENINGGYHGWDAGAVGRAKEICFCIVSTDGTKRTNVIKAGG